MGIQRILKGNEHPRVSAADRRRSDSEMGEGMASASDCRGWERRTENAVERISRSARTLLEGYSG